MIWDANREGRLRTDPDHPRLIQVAFPEIAERIKAWR